MTRSPKPCGTPAAYKRHVANGEKPCEACLIAKRDYERACKRRQLKDPVYRQKKIEYLRSPEVRRRTNDAHLRKKYGITLLDYEAMRIEQNDECAICSRNFSAFKRSPAVDHCHVTGRVRALLCSPCNVLLGCAKEEHWVLIRAAAYLRIHKAKP